MHKAQQYIKTNLFPGTPSAKEIEIYVLSYDDATQIRSRLHNDAINYIYSATITFGDAIRGIRERLFTWPIVKLYYSTFYTYRALLALDNICLFYIGTKAFCVKAKSGKSPQKKKGQTHKIVLNEFITQNSSHPLLSQEINYEKPPNWLMNLREDANYRCAKFEEPDTPKHFQQVDEIGIRRALKAYLCDTSYTYVFDAEHAIIAYPLETLRFAYKQLGNQAVSGLRSTEISCICDLFCDKNGPIPEMHNLIKSIQS